MNFSNKRELWTIPVIGVLVSVLLCYLTFQYEQDKEHNKFTTQSDRVFKNLRNTFNELDNANESIKLLFNTTDIVTEDQFKLFIQPTLSRYSFIENIYYIPKIQRINKEKIEKQKQNEGYTGFHFRDFSDENFAPSPNKNYLFPISYVQPYNVATSTLIGQDILTFKHVQKTILATIQSGNKIMLSPGLNTIYAFNALYFGKNSFLKHADNIDNVYALISFKISASKLIKYIKLPTNYKIGISINNVSIIPKKINNNSSSIFNSDHIHTNQFTFNDQTIKTQSKYIKYFFNYNLTVPTFVFSLGLLLTLLSWYVFRTNINFNIILSQQNKIIEAEVTEKTEKLEKQTKELEISYQDQLATTHELKLFSYSISHDLRAPLRTINGFSEILVDDYTDSLDDEARSHLKRIIKATKRMEELIESMLNLALVSRSEIKKENVSFTTMANEIIIHLKKLHPERKIEVSIDDDLDAYGDRVLLQSVIENLINNAWKFTQKNNDAKIDFYSKIENDQVTYFIKDNGVGFDMKYSDKLFKPFQRLHGNTFEGTGIGLATVARIINRHRGKISVTANPDEGAIFNFTLGS